MGPASNEQRLRELLAEVQQRLTEVKEVVGGRPRRTRAVAAADRVDADATLASVEG
jgi:hypothetical protein